MRRILLPLLLGFGVLFAFVATLGFLWTQSREEPEEIVTLSPEMGDVTVKTVATGAVVPRNEVAIKSRVSGVVEALEVEPGDRVEAGDLMARIRIIPDSATLNSAQSAVRQARIELDDAAVELERSQSLAARGAASAAEVQRLATSFDLADQAHRAAVGHLQIIREGAARGIGDLSTDVTSTVSGMVLSVDVKVGHSVIESNTFNEGTTIAAVADMTDMVFEGFVDESEVGKLAEGMDLDLTVGALDDATLDGTLEYISPKSIDQGGAVQFEIRAAIVDNERFIRAGSSANADIVLDKVDDALTLDERALRFEADTVWVEVQDGSNWIRRDLKVGLSDGIRIEVKAGLSPEDVVRVPPRPF